MKKFQIRLTPNEARHFVEVARHCDIDIDIAYNRYIDDAKSILGVMGLDFTKDLTVTCFGFNKAFDEMLRNYAVAC